MQEFVIFFENGTNTIISCDFVKESDNYINFYTNRPTEFAKDILVAQFIKNKIAGYSMRYKVVGM